MTTRWSKIRSWHIVDEQTVPLAPKTLCGLDFFGAIAEDMPGHEASCETCLKLAVRHADTVTVAPEPTEVV